MDLKAFKGLPHEFGGIDYTEGSEVEGGEFAVNIGKSGNEYIFDKNSSEGEKLSKEYKRLDMNGRLSEDDPLALEAFDQIAREEALKHAQRSVNEKGIDPFRNMYDQGGQAANGGVKYAAGGAKDMYFFGGMMGGMGSMMGGMSGGSGGIGSFLGMTDLMGSTQGERGGETTQSPMDFAGMFKSKEAQQDVAEAQQKIDPNAMSNSGGLVSGIGSTLENLIKSTNNAGDVEQQSSYRSSPDDLTLSKGTKYVQPNQADTAGAVIGGAATGFEQGMQFGPIGGAIGAVIGGVTKPLMENKRAKEQQDAADEQFLNNLAFSRNEELEKQQQMNVAGDVNSGRTMDQYPGLFASTGTRSAKQGGAMPKQKPIYGYYANGGGKSYTDKIKESDSDSYLKKFQGGGGKEKEELLTGPTGPTGPTGAQGVIGAEGVIGPSTAYSTSNQVSSEDFASDPGMIPVRRDDTCVKGMNCFDDIAGMDVIPNWITNNRDLEKFFNSPEGKEAYEQVSAIDAKAGDMVQFTRPVDVTNPKKGAREAASYALNYGGNPLNYPYHVGLMNSDSTYLGDGSAELPVHEKSIYMDDDKRFDFESAGIFGDAAKFFMTDDNKKKANYYRLKDKEARQKQLDAAIKAKKDGVDISRQLYKNETPTGYVGNPYYNSRGSYPSAY